MIGRTNGVLDMRDKRRYKNSSTGLDVLIVDLTPAVLCQL